MNNLFLLGKAGSKQARLPLYEIINLSVATNNKKAISLYEKLGFNIYGEQKNAIKLNDEYIDLYLMTKDNDKI